MHVSEELKLPKGHENFDFVDVVTDDDTKLFIDPCLVELQRNEWQATAYKTLESYFDVFYALYRQNEPKFRKLEHFRFAHEINATKLGYGNGANGHCKTEEGMYETFLQIDEQLKGITLETPSDLVVLISDFAEDCMSDMLTNILFKSLNEFTLQICASLGHPTELMHEEYHYWNADDYCWKSYRNNCLLVNGELILLVPKNIVRHGYVFSLDNYFHRVLLERLQQEKRITKKALEKEIRSANPNINSYIIDSTKNDPTLLHEYNRRMTNLYADKVMSDQELDEIVYANGR